MQLACDNGGSLPLAQGTVLTKVILRHEILLQDVVLPPAVGIRISRRERSASMPAERMSGMSKGNGIVRGRGARWTSTPNSPSSAFRVHGELEERSFLDPKAFRIFTTIISLHEIGK